jgi:Rad3-related DNA helicase
LPACNTVIIDEAHRAPDVATVFFGESTSMLQLTELARDAELEQRRKAATRRRCSMLRRPWAWRRARCGLASMPAQANFCAAMRWPGASFSMRWIV